MALKVLINIDSLVTVDAKGADFKTGTDMQEIGLKKDSAIVFDDRIRFIGTSKEALDFVAEQKNTPVEVKDMSGKTVMPGFVDSHSHIVFGGNRTEEFARRLRGVTYQQIAEEGGGIQTTVRGTRQATLNQLIDNGRKLASNAIRYGTTTLESKSGYSLNTEGEINQLRATQYLNEEMPIELVSTFLGAHDFPIEFKNDRKGYINQIKKEMLPIVAGENLAEYGDAFIDKGYYTIDEGREVLEACLDAGLKIKVHCDELADVGAAKLAAELGAVSADHLLFVSDESLEAMKSAGTVAGLLPATAYFIRMPYANARKMIDNDVIVCVATDCNPGSSFTENMQNILSLSVINMGMTAEEAIVASTLNAAHSLNRSSEVGSLEIGKKANLIVFDSPNYTDLFYHFGVNHVEQTWIDGNKIYDRYKSWDLNY